MVKETVDTDVKDVGGEQETKDHKGHTGDVVVNDGEHVANIHAGTVSALFPANKDSRAVIDPSIVGTHSGHQGVIPDKNIAGTPLETILDDDKDPEQKAAKPADQKAAKKAKDDSEE